MKSIDAKEIVDFLNDTFDADQVALLGLISHRVPCNDTLRDHPFVVCGRSDAGGSDVGIVGVLNGLLASAGSPDVIGYQCDDHERPIGRFCTTPFAPYDGD